jgi:two-component system, NarL family, nitrate/nitrite response regulator NarL
VKQVSLNRIRLVLAEGQPVSLAGLVAVFGTDSSFAVLQRCSDGRETVRAVIKHTPDVVLIGDDIPPTGAASVVRTLRSNGVRTRMVLLADSSESDTFEWARQSDVSGIVFKTMDPRVIINRVKDVFLGKHDLHSDFARHRSRAVISPPESSILTPRQLEVARAAASGLSNKELATRLSVSEGTVKNHLHAIYEKLKVEGRIQLLHYLEANAMISNAGSAGVETPRMSTNRNPQSANRQSEARRLAR